MAHSLFNVENAVNSAFNRIGDGKRLRKVRTDSGGSRMTAPVRAFLEKELSGFERPSMQELLQRLALFCRKNSQTAPSRITVYRFIEKVAAPRYQIADLPGDVREALYNLDTGGEVPGGQLVFYCFNYGSIRAISFASGLPWICLYQADRMSGHRPQARSLLEAIMKTRGI